MRLGQAQVVIGKRIAERVVGMRMVGLQSDQLLQAGLEQVHAPEFLRQMA